MVDLPEKTRISISHHSSNTFIVQTLGLFLEEKMQLTPSFSPPSRWRSDQSLYERWKLLSELQRPCPERRGVSERFFSPQSDEHSRSQAHTQAHTQGDISSSPSHSEGETHTHAERASHEEPANTHTLSLFDGAFSLPLSRPETALTDNSSSASVCVPAKAAKRSSFGKLLSAAIDTEDYMENNANLGAAALGTQAVREKARASMQRVLAQTKAAKASKSSSVGKSLSANNSNNNNNSSNGYNQNNTDKCRGMVNPFSSTTSNKHSNLNANSSVNAATDIRASSGSAKTVPFDANSKNSNNNNSNNLLSALSPQDAQSHTHTLSLAGGGKRARSTERERDRETERASFAETDLEGIQRACRNAGGTAQGLRAFSAALAAAAVHTHTATETAGTGAPVGDRAVCVSFLFRDLSSNYASHSQRLCTPSQHCFHWNCTCERAVRSPWLRDALLGALVLIDTPTHTHASREPNVPFFLPLTLCAQEPDCKLSALLHRGRTTLPLMCETTLAERWAALWALFCDTRTVKVLFHTQVALQVVWQSVSDYRIAIAREPQLATVVDFPFSTHTKTDTQNASTQHAGAQRTQKSFPVWFSGVFDPKIAAYLLNSDVCEEDLEFATLLSHTPHTHSHALSSHTPSGRMGSLARSLAQLSHDLSATLSLYRTQSAALSKQGLLSLLWRVESPVSSLLAEMERRGVCVDHTALCAMRDRLEAMLAATEKEIFSTSGLRFNVASPEQVSHVLYDRLGLGAAAQPAASSHTSHKHKQKAVSDENDELEEGAAPIPRGKKFLSTSEEALRKIAHAHAVVPLILTYRTLAKLRGTYMDSLETLLLGETHTRGERECACVHANWHQTSVRTGRLSCCKPNLQNMPNDETLCGETLSVRGLFPAREGCVFVSADYSQVEMRVLAHVTADTALCQLFRERGDVYRHLAARIFRKSSSSSSSDGVSEVSETERDRAKVICLGVIYGMGPHSAAARLGIDVSTSAKITHAFLDHFAQVKDWIARVKSLAKQEGHVKTILGRIRALPDLQRGDDWRRRSAAERQAVNSIIQGSASDLIKCAMLFTTERLSAMTCPRTQETPRLAMQIHDELIFEVPAASEEFVRAVVLAVRDAMERQVSELLSLRVPLLVNVSIGKTWGSLCEWKDDRETNPMAPADTTK